MAEHCVQLIFPFTGRDLKPVFDLEEALSAAIADNRAGEFDGNEVGDGQAILYMYGPDADALYSAIVPVVRTAEIAVDGVVVRRYGPPEDGVREVNTPVRQVSV
jgi:hypothetical protein